MDEAFPGISRYHHIVDDIIIYNSDITQHAPHVRQFFQQCAEKRITLNTNKWKFAQPMVNFAGFSMSADGYHIDCSITQAISNFPTPANQTDLPSFIGLANQNPASTVIVTKLLTPLRPLLSTKNSRGQLDQTKPSLLQRNLSHQPLLSHTSTPPNQCA